MCPVNEPCSFRCLVRVSGWLRFMSFMIWLAGWAVSTATCMWQLPAVRGVETVRTSVFCPGVSLVCLPSQNSGDPEWEAGRDGHSLQEVCRRRRHLWGLNWWCNISYSSTKRKGQIPYLLIVEMLNYHPTLWALKNHCGW